MHTPQLVSWPDTTHAAKLHFTHTLLKHTHPHRKDSNLSHGSQ